MPKNKVTDPITDQEIAFARLVLSGTMTDRRAAETAGLSPNSAAYTKSKPRVRAYLSEHSSAVRQQLVDQDAAKQNRLNQSRERLLARLWVIGDLNAEVTRGNMSSQVKALSLIAAIEGHIPDRRPAPAQSKPEPPPEAPDIYTAAWMGKQKEGKNENPEPPPIQENAAPEPPSAPPKPTPEISELSVFTAPVNPPPAAYSVPRVPMADYFAPDTRVPFSIKP
jgi:hypothetical protein